MGLCATGVLSLSTLSPMAAPGATADPDQFPSDEYGYVDTAARCDEGQTVMMFGRTSRALVVVCVGPDGQLEYRGVRLSDQAEITVGASRSSTGAITAVNDDVTYTIAPSAFTVFQDGEMLYRDAWVEYHQPRFPNGSTTTTPATTPPASPGPAAVTTTPVTTTPTVSTTTVTPPPRTRSADG